MSLPTDTTVWLAAANDAATFVIIYDGLKLGDDVARVSTYLNFMGQSEQAMNWYQSIFNGSFVTPFMRYNDTPPNPDAPPLSEDEGNQIMHVELEILSGHVIMATDMLESDRKSVV